LKIGAGVVDRVLQTHSEFCNAKVRFDGTSDVDCCNFEVISWWRESVINDLLEIGLSRQLQNVGEREFERLYHERVITLDMNAKVSCR